MAYDGTEALAAAIVKQACDDYVEGAKLIKYGNGMPLSALRNYNSACMFLRDDNAWACELCGDIKPSYIKAKLDREMV